MGQRRHSRQRRLLRRRRPHKRSVYTAAAATIQRFFRAYLLRRYSSICQNYADTDCITLEPVSLIPRLLLVVLDGQAFDARGLVKWLVHSKTHPLTRRPIDPYTFVSCMQKLHYFILQDEQLLLSNKEKGFCRRRMFTRLRQLKHIMRKV